MVSVDGYFIKNIWMYIEKFGIKIWMVNGYVDAWDFAFIPDRDSIHVKK